MAKNRALAFATITATLTPTNSSLPAISFKADTILNEDEILSEPTSARELGQRFMGADGESSDVIENWATNGTRDLTIRDNDVADKIKEYAYSRPRVHFNFDFRYQRNTADDADAITQQHFDCFIQNTPGRSINPTVNGVKFTINYAKYQEVNSAGEVLGD